MNKWIEKIKNRDLNLYEADLHKADLRKVNLCGANLCGANLRRADLLGANLLGANLCGAYLNGADLRWANLCDTDLYDTNLRWANLSGVNLSGAYLGEANLYEANLSGANLRGADLCGAKNVPDLSKFYQTCPTEGDFIAWKKVRNGIVLKLLVKGKRVSPYTGRKCRTDKVKVLAAYGSNGKKTDAVLMSKHDSTFIYKVGRLASVKDYDPSPLVECSTGIYFFITRQEAEDW